MIPFGLQHGVSGSIGGRLTAGPARPEVTATPSSARVSSASTKRTPLPTRVVTCGVFVPVLTDVRCLWWRKSRRVQYPRKGVTLRLLWLEYQEAVAANAHGLAYQYSQFCDLYGSWKGKLALSMRQTHHADEKAFIDFSGDQPTLVDLDTG